MEYTIGQVAKMMVFRPLPTAIMMRKGFFHL